MRRFLPALLSLALATPALAGSIHKWVDDEGQVHYGAQPPAGVSSQEVGLRGIGPASPDSQDTVAAPTSANEQTASSASTPPEQNAEDTEFLREQCQIARQNLDVLKASGANRRFRDDSGEAVRYDAEQLTAEIDKNEQYIGNYCQDA